MFKLGDTGRFVEVDTLISLLRKYNASSAQFGKKVQSWKQCKLVVVRDCHHHLEEIGFEKHLLNEWYNRGVTKMFLYLKNILDVFPRHMFPQSEENIILINGNMKKGTSCLEETNETTHPM